MKSKSDDLFDKTKEFAGKAEEFLDEQYKKLKESDAFGKVTEMAGKVADTIEKKADEFQQSDIPEKLEGLYKKGTAKSEEIIDQAKSFGTILADDVEEVIGNLRDKISRKKGIGKEK